MPSLTSSGNSILPPTANPIRLQNPLAAQYAVMRSTLIGGLVEILQNNLNRKQNRVRVFEIARVFSKGSNGQFVQNERIGGLWYGAVMPEQWGEKTRNADFYDIKADVENLLKNKAVEFVKTEHPALHPGRAANIVSDGQVIGFVGELHPKWLQNTTCRKHRWYLKSIWQPCWNAKKRVIRQYRNFSRCAGIWLL